MVHITVCSKFLSNILTGMPLYRNFFRICRITVSSYAKSSNRNLQRLWNKDRYRSLYIQHSIIELIQRLRKEQQEQAKKCGDLWVECDRLFITWNGKPLRPSAPYKWFKRFCEHEKLTFKALLRPFVDSQALASGIDVKAVSNMLGHSQTSTTLNIYAHAVQQAN